MKPTERDRYAQAWRREAKSMIPPTGSAGLSGASFYTIADYYKRNEMGGVFSNNAVLKISQSGSIAEELLNQLDTMQSKLGPQYDQAFVPTQVVTIGSEENIQGLISPQFLTTVAERLRGKTPPPRMETTQIFQNIVNVLDALSSTAQSCDNTVLVAELQESLFFVSDILDSQIDKSSSYKDLPIRIGEVADKVSDLVPTSNSLSANDAWLGNFAIINSQKDIRLFDPMPTLPLVKIDEFTKRKKQKNIPTPLLRNSLLDYGRVSVNMKRTILEWNSKGWGSDAQYIEDIILPEFRRRSIEKIGEDALILGELLNNAYFSICNCVTCSESGYLNLAYQELDRIINQIND